MNTTTHHNRFETVAETAKAVCLRVGAIYSPYTSEITLPNGETFQGYFADCWVPKSCIVDGQIAEWFANREIAPKFMTNAVLNIIF